MTDAAPAADPPRPSGFGGWLLVLAIVVCLSPLRSLVELTTSLKDLKVALLVPELKVLFAFEAAIELGYLALQIVVVVVMLGRRASFAKWYTWLWVATWLLPAIDLLVVMALTNVPPAKIIDVTHLRPLFAGVGMTLWVWYVHVSVRVRNTFTN